jgi:hypothetical protein
MQVMYPDHEKSEIWSCSVARLGIVCRVREVAEPGYEDKIGPKPDGIALFTCLPVLSLRTKQAGMPAERADASRRPHPPRR